MIPEKLLPEKWQPFAFIAGGYAACPSLAGDMDVWVLAPCPFRNRHEPEKCAFDDLRVHVWLQQRREELLTHLRRNYTRWQVAEETENRSVEHDGVPTPYTHDLAHMVLRVAKITSHSLPIHLLVVDAEFPKQVIDGFDISTHSVALVPDVGVVRGSNWTPITDVPEVLRTNEKTPDRMDKICTRYGVRNPLKPSEGKVLQFKNVTQPSLFTGGY